MVPQPPTNDIDKILQSQGSKSLGIRWFSIPLLTFGFLGLIWSIPFPHLDFLGKYNGFVNWASFVIAFSIYYYYKLSPVLSYGILLVVFSFSAGIVALEKLHTNHNWPPMGIVCLGIFVLGLALQFVGQTDANPAKTLLNGPLWLMNRLFQKVGILA